METCFFCASLHFDAYEFGEVAFFYAPFNKGQIFFLVSIRIHRG